MENMAQLEHIPVTYVYSYSHTRPTGGQRDTYSLVDTLNQLGFPAAVFHEAQDFRLQWFRNTTVVISHGEFIRRLKKDRDWVVLPEDLGMRIKEYPGKKIIYNKGIVNGFLSFGNDSHLQYPYSHPEVVASIVVSKHNEAILRYAFPELECYVINPAIDLDLFKFTSLPDKATSIACSAKGRASTTSLLHVLPLAQINRSTVSVSLSGSRLSITVRKNVLAYYSNLACSSSWPRMKDYRGW